MFLKSLNLIEHRQGSYEIILQFEITVFYLNIYLKCSLFLWYQSRIFSNLQCHMTFQEQQRSLMDFQVFLSLYGLFLGRFRDTSGQKRKRIADTEWLFLENCFNMPWAVTVIAPADTQLAACLNKRGCFQQTRVLFAA